MNEMNEQFNEEIFQGKTFSDLLKDIYVNVQKKTQQISDLVAELKPLCKNTGDATLIMPLVKDFVDTDVRNNEQLVKMAAVIQRVLQPNKNESASNSILTPEEEAQLRAAYDEIVTPLNTTKATTTIVNNTTGSNDQVPQSL